MILLQSEKDTQKLAQSLALVIRVPLLVFLEGGLGVGKTFFVRSLVQSLGFTGAVKSPTYSFLETYSTAKGPINHFDLYRFNHALEWYDLGFDDMTSSLAINLIEWPEKISALELCPDIILTMQYRGLARYINIEGNSIIGKELVDEWIKK